MVNSTHIKGAKEAPKAVRSKMDTLLVTRDILQNWAMPRFQRELRENEKVRALAEVIKNNGGIIPGVVTLGKLDEAILYLVDGQHRRHAALMSGLEEFITDVRICTFDSMADMAEEFVKLQLPLVVMRPDDKLRALEEGSRVLQYLRKECPFISYGQVRRNANSAVLSASTAIKCWVAGMRETPSVNESAVDLVSSLVENVQIEHAAKFYQIARNAWGTEPSSYRLWAMLNLAMCAWLYQQLVVDKQRGVKRYVVLSPDQFKRCMMSVGAAADYNDWLVGRSLSERDRSVCYTRIKNIFTERLREDTKEQKPRLPVPAWWTSK